MVTKLSVALANSLGFTRPDLEALVLELLRETETADELKVLFERKLGLAAKSAKQLANSLLLLKPELGFGANNAPLKRESESAAPGAPPSAGISIQELRQLAEYDYLKKRELDRLELAKKRNAETAKLYARIKVGEIDAFKDDIAKRMKKVSQIEHIISERQKPADIMTHKLFLDTRPEPSEEQFAHLRSNLELDKVESRDAASSSSKFELRQPLKADSKTFEFIDTDGRKITFIDTFAQQTAGDSNFASHREYVAKKLRALVKTQSEMELARQRLPIFLFKNQLLQTIRDNIVTIVVGEPGSGKTTQLPQYLHEIGYTASGKVMVTQPRRVAAMSVAKRVAEEMGVNLGAEVGYSIRFDTRVSDSTAIVYATDGILLQQFTHDPTLMAYSAIMVDEAHERSLNTDVLLAFLKDLALFRNGSLRLVIASATLNAQMFSDFFGGAPIFRIPNRCHPVRVFHTKFGVSNYVECSANTAVQLHLSRPLPGDVLIFLPGQQEILACCERVRELLEETGGATAQASVLLVPFYSALSQDEQRTVFCKTPKNRRKIVVATNVAETSITIEGVVYVIDSGLVKQSFYDAKSGMEWLKVVNCSRASCVQRAGRAGRTQAGFCLRLFPKKTFDEELEVSNPAEMTCSNLTGLVLRLKHLGIDDVLNFDYVEAPPTLLLENALNNLFALQLIDAAGALTAAGATAALLPCSAQNAAAVLASCIYNCTNEVCMVVALLELEAGVLLPQPVHPALLRENLGDFVLQLAIFRGYIAARESPQWCADHGIDERGMLRARNIHLQLTALLPTLGLPVRSSESVVDVLKSLLRGYFCNLAKSNGNRSYTLVQNREVVAQLHPASALLCRRRGKDATQSFFRVQALPKLVMFKELVFTKKQFLRGLMPVDPEWVREVAPEYFESVRDFLLSA